MGRPRAVQDPFSGYIPKQIRVKLQGPISKKTAIKRPPSGQKGGSFFDNPFGLRTKLSKKKRKRKKQKGGNILDDISPWSRIGSGLNSAGKMAVKRKKPTKNQKGGDGWAKHADRDAKNHVGWMKRTFG
jgi:hypothetical protein